MLPLRIPMACSALLALACSAGLSHAQYGARATTLPAPQMLEPFGLERAWWSQATLNGGRDRVAHLTNDEDMVYAQSTSGLVTAFDAETGQKRWALQLGRPDQPTQAITSNEVIALAVHGIEMFAIDKLTGETLWTLRLPATPSTSPAIDRSHVYIGSTDGSVYAFDLKKIHELYNENRLPQWSYQTLKWRYATAKAITTPPVPASIPLSSTTGAAANGSPEENSARVVNFASRDNSLYSVDAGTRDLNFRFETDAPVSAPLARKEGYLFLPTGDSRLYCISEQNGSVRWDHVTGLPVKKKPHLVDDDLFLIQHGGGLLTLSAMTGEPKWRSPNSREFLAATPTLVFAADRLGNVVLMDREDGAARGTLPLRQFTSRISNERTDRLYLATATGLVVCLRERGREFPIYYQNPDRRPVLPEFAPEDGENTSSEPRE